ncbi:MAG: Clp1/GlmU family protein [Thermodesulfobacteriota bacterium]
MGIISPEEWYALLDALEKEKGIAILLGATDTGKSTLAKFLISHLCQRGLKVALVDADIGQSFLGPPTTIGLALFKSHPDWEVVLSPPEILFVGSTTPEGHFPIHLKGVKRMVDKAISYGPEVILVDTTGFILGEAGKELKRRKIDLLSPRFIIALQKSDEIEHVLVLYIENHLYKIHRLPLSKQVRPRSIEERRVNRTNKFRDYFKHSVTQELSIEEIQIEGEVLDPNGDSIPLDWALRINGLLIGLKDGNDDTLALGVLDGFVDEERVLRVSTPLVDLEKVKTLQLSSLKLTASYEEEKF